MKEMLFFKILLLCGILEKCSCSALGGVRKRSKESNIRSIRSYAPGFPQGFGEDFPGAGNYGQVNYQNPDISSSYSTYGPNANSDFGSITYTNYPPTTTSIDGSFPFGGSSQSYSNGGISYSSSGVSNPFLTSNAFQNYPSYSSYPPSTSYASSFPGNYQSNQFNGQLSDGYSESFSRPTSFGGSSNTDIQLGSETTIRYPSKFFGSSMSHKPSEEAIFGPSGSTYFGNNVKPSSAHFSPSYKPNGNGGFANNLKGHDVEQVSQHIEVTRPVAVPIYKKFPVPKSKYIQVAIPHPVLVPFPQPYPVRIPISEPVGVPVLKEIYIPVEKEVPYPVEKEVAVPVEKPVPYTIEKHYPIYKAEFYPLKIPVIKTIVHKSNTPLADSIAGWLSRQSTSNVPTTNQNTQNIQNNNQQHPRNHRLNANKQNKFKSKQN